MSRPPLNSLESDALIARKDELVSDLAGLLRRHGLMPDYPWNVMVAAGEAKLESEARILILEHLLEIESIKYTLAARMLREAQE